MASATMAQSLLRSPATVKICRRPLTREKISKFTRIQLLQGGSNTRLFVTCCNNNNDKSSTISGEDSLSKMCEINKTQLQLQQNVSRYERLFSNLNEVTLKRDSGSMTSAILLVAGTTVGAGILAIPAVTQESGFLASAVTCLLCWLYMVVTGILVAEVNVNTMCELGSGGVSLVSMAMRTLGKGGVQVACWSYLFIHYALLVAYVARSSDTLSNFLGIPLWQSAILFSSIFGGICYYGSQRVIGAINGFLVFGLLISFAILVGVAAYDVDWSSLLQANVKSVPQSIPIICLAFVYQNVVPVLCTNLEGNLPRVRTAIVVGTSIPLAMFLVWDAVVLGTISHLNASGVIVVDPLLQLRSMNGIVGPIVETFSFLALATSYIGFVLGLTDFLSDLLKLPARRGQQPLPYFLTIVPPVIFSLLNPNIFFKALDFAGTYGVLVLFGILPAAMAWAERYSKACLSPIFPTIVPGGRITLCIVMGAAELDVEITCMQVIVRVEALFKRNITNVVKEDEDVEEEIMAFAPVPTNSEM